MIIISWTDKSELSKGIKHEACHSTRQTILLDYTTFHHLHNVNIFEVDQNQATQAFHFDHKHALTISNLQYLKEAAWTGTNVLLNLFIFFRTLCQHVSVLFNSFISLYGIG